MRNFSYDKIVTENLITFAFLRNHENLFSFNIILKKFQHIREQNMYFDNISKFKYETKNCIFLPKYM
jgi:hypothetical protein